MWLGLVFLFGGFFSSDVPTYEIIKTNTPIAQIYYVHDENASRTTAELVYPIGEADMTGTEGIAHYVEHLVAWNALPEDTKDAGRDFNASTWVTFTRYYMDSGEISDVMTYLADTIAPIALDQAYMIEEADIVQNEFQLRLAEDPYAPLWDEFNRAAYRGTSLTRSVMGSPDHIVKFDPERAIMIHEEKYNLSDATMVVQSPLSKGDVKKAIELAFKDAPAKAPSERALYDEKLRFEGHDNKTIQSDKIRGVTYVSSIISPVPEDYDPLEMEVLMRFANDALGSSKAGMISRKLEFEENLFSQPAIYVAYAPAKLGIEISLNGLSQEGTEPQTLSAQYLEWLEGIDNHREIIEEIVKKGKENIAENLENWNAEDEIQLIFSQIYQHQTRPVNYKEIAKASENITADQVIEFLKSISQERRIVDRIWEGIES